MNFPVFDLHCDTALALWEKDFQHCNSLFANSLHVDLKRAKALPGFTQCFACFTTTGNSEDGASPEFILKKELLFCNSYCDCS